MMVAVRWKKPLKWQIKHYTGQKKMAVIRSLLWIREWNKALAYCFSVDLTREGIVDKYNNENLSTIPFIYGTRCAA